MQQEKVLKVDAFFKQCGNDIGAKAERFIMITSGRAGIPRKGVFEHRYVLLSCPVSVTLRHTLGSPSQPEPEMQHFGDMWMIDCDRLRNQPGKPFSGQYIRRTTVIPHCTPVHHARRDRRYKRIKAEHARQALICSHEKRSTSSATVPLGPSQLTVSQGITCGGHAPSTRNGEFLQGHVIYCTHPSFHLPSLVN